MSLWPAAHNKTVSEQTLISWSPCTTDYMYKFTVQGYHLFWKTWKSRGIQKWLGKCQGMCKKTGKTWGLSLVTEICLQHNLCNVLVILFFSRRSPELRWTDNR